MQAKGARRRVNKAAYALPRAQTESPRRPGPMLSQRSRRSRPPLGRGECLGALTLGKRCVSLVCLLRPRNTSTLKTTHHAPVAPGGTCGLGAIRDGHDFDVLFAVSRRR
ncbi:uncharacterized protein BDZ99DRAFT_185694 [Mytilinidion resinicola]|uniref:Uncharacterized protein n=1 Tax=Mytilinidion resinicola TaxID=574789 RepID=A0A6A6Z2A1_9PEZI|nr:uncharacterized protein BDZ99DRAFT_185694 [Mytilinidion resinicola]KAF2814849.1 hypothetical protein BDZ99DRAFT_185694 [Mytilinidion resinicola]